MIDFNFRGLAVEAEMEEYAPGSYMVPPSGGGCTHWEFEVEDIDEVLGWLDLGEVMDDLIRAGFRLTGEVPQALVEKLEREWDEDIREAAYYHG